MAAPGGVFSNAINEWIDACLELKMDEINRARMTPYPVEFDVYC
jgi:glutamine synthetase